MKFITRKQMAALLYAALAAVVLADLVGCSSGPKQKMEVGDEDIKVQNKDDSLPFSAQTLDGAIDAAKDYLEKNLESGVHVAVIKFDSPNEALSLYVINELSARLERGKKINIVDRHQLDLIREEQKLALSGEVSDESMVSIGHLIQAQWIIEGHIQEMGGEWHFVIKALNVETGKSRPYTYLLKNPSVWKNSRLSLGARAGGAPRFYTLEDIQGEADTGGAFEGGLQLGVFLYDLFMPGLDIGAQTELLFSGDTVSYSGRDLAGDFSASFTSYTLAIPLLAKVSYRIQDRFSIPLFLGPVFTIPLGKIEYASGDISGSYPASIPAGFIVGIAPGFKLGPGTLFADIRFSRDFGPVSIKDSSGGTLAAYTRSALSFSLGYEIGIKWW
jgi:hypothetical protein